MNFNDYLATFDSVEHLSGIDIVNQDNEVVHHIPAIAGKLGSLKLYYALAKQFDKRLNAEAAEQGLIWFAEHVQDALAHVGKHPNIDLLLQAKEQQVNWTIEAIEA